MRRFVLICLAILMTAGPCVAQEDSCCEEPMQLAMLYGMFGTSAPLGTNAWFYSCTDTPESEPSWLDYYAINNTRAYCSPVTISQSGTATKLSVKAGETYGTQYAKIALYDTSGNELANCSDPTSSFVDETWLDCDLSSNYYTASGNYYICTMASLNSGYFKYIDVDSQQTNSDRAYADFPYSTLSLYTLSSKCLALKVYVE